MDTLPSPADFVRLNAPERPVACLRPHLLANAAQWFVNRFPGTPHYAVKANPSPWALDALARGGLRAFDVASDAEVALARRRVPQADLAYMNPVKSRRSIARAYYEQGVRAFSLDCLDELDKIVAETNHAQDLTLVIRVAVDNTGSELPLAGKFGVTMDDGPELLRAARQKGWSLGVAFHVGSQCMDPRAYRRAMADVSHMIARAGVVVDVVNVGGGFPAIYPGMTPPPMEAYVRAIEAGFEDMLAAENAELWCEPGRALVAEGASILARVELRKGDALFLNDGAFGNLFDAAHMKWRYPVRLIRADGEVVVGGAVDGYRFYGPTCDSMDQMPGPFLLPTDVREGDYIEIGMLGAYGTTLSTGFNGFGETDVVVVEDQPWPSMYVDTPVPARRPAPVIPFAARRLEAKSRL